MKKRWQVMRACVNEIFSVRTTIWRKLQMLFRFLRACIFDTPAIDQLVSKIEAVSGNFDRAMGGHKQDWDKEFEGLQDPVENPVVSFTRAVMTGESFKHPITGKESKVGIDTAFLFEGRFDEDGRLLRDTAAIEAASDGWPADHRIRKVKGTESFKAAILAGAKTHESQPAKAQKARAARAVHEAMARRFVKEGMCGDGFLTSFGFGPTSSYDPNQYTEFAPTAGGPFFKQLYLFDYLRMHAYSFEAWNHNPLAKRIIEILTHYTFGRRFTMRIKDERKEKAWDAADHKYHISTKVCRFWSKEGNIYGELMVDKETWTSIDPSTVWDIITAPDNVDDPYYYYQSYPTAFQMFTGLNVVGAPGAAQQKPQEYILRQIPAQRVLHLKFNCVSNEKRGRSVLFSILGWLKRVKDLYNAQVIRQWLLAQFVWDITIKGNQNDVNAYAQAWKALPDPGGMHVHNENVERKAMPAGAGSGTGSDSKDVSENLLAFVATAVGLPKEFLNIISTGGGSRAQALTTAEPFTKVVEDLQSAYEEFLADGVFATVMQQAGLDYDRDDVEILFPSVTKDTTSETLQNLALAYAERAISKRMEAEMMAKELNITQYDFDEVQKQLKAEDAQGLGTSGLPPQGRFGGGMGDDDGSSEIHGQGKVDLSDQLKSL